MIKFFRKIRQKLLANNKFSKYLLYAIGEIILVVIGILIALQINNWNEEQKHKKLQTVYLENIKNELEVNQSLMEQIILDRYERKIVGLKKAKSYANNTLMVTDTLKFLSDVGYGAVFGNGIEFLNSSVFEELKSTGNIQLITNTALRKDIVDYHGYVVKQIINLRNVATDYMHFTNSLKVFNRDNPDSIPFEDRVFMMKNLKSDKTIFLSNLEINYGNHVFYLVEALHQSTTDLISNIEQELAK